MFRDSGKDISNIYVSPPEADIPSAALEKCDRKAAEQIQRLDILPGDKVLSSHPLSMGKVFEVREYPRVGNPQEGNSYEFVLTTCNQIISISFLEKIPHQEPLTTEFNYGDEVVILFHEKNPYLIGTTQIISQKGNKSVKFQSGEYAMSYDDICHASDNPIVSGCPEIKVGGVYYSIFLKSKIKVKRIYATKGELICFLPGDTCSEVPVQIIDVRATKESPLSPIKPGDSVEIVGKIYKGKRGVVERVDSVIWVMLPGKTIANSFYAHQVKVL
ncbi:hypothetical protein IQ240_24755 [Nodularia sp. LEGE 04288]|nr:hypothetical protein [Nodularia sp. LEGE 04288]